MAAVPVIAGGTQNVSIRGGGDNPTEYGSWHISKAGVLHIDWDDGTAYDYEHSTFIYEYNGQLILNLNGTYYKKID